MHTTFFQKVLLTLIAAAFAAALIQVYRHVVQEAFYESNEGWKSLYIQSPTPHR